MIQNTLAGWLRLAVVSAAIALPSAAFSQFNPVKLVDLGGVIGGGTDPYSTPILVGNELWFTTSAGGGTTGFGTISKYNLESNTLSVAYVMDGTGNTPYGKLTQAGDYLYYTTARGGAGDRGTISAFNMRTGQNSVLYQSPSSSAGQPHTFHGGVAYVDRGDGTASLYALQQLGGVTNSNGGLIKLSLDLTTMAATSSLLATMPESTTAGRQPWEGFAQVGDKLYFTLANGGPVVQGVFNNGAGAIGSLDITNDAVNLGWKMLDGGDGSAGLPMSDLTYDPVTNAMYTVTNGTAAQSGALVKIGMDGTQTTLYEFTAGAPYPDGRYGMGAVAVVEGKVYMSTWQGGAGGGGTISQFDLTTNEYIKLFDGNNTAGDNFGGEPRGGFYPVRDAITGEYDIYFLGRQGGVNDKGTLVKFHVVPEPQTALLGLAGLSLLGFARRRQEKLGHE